MKTLILTLTLILVSVDIAFACSGTEGYSKAVKVLEKNLHLSADQKSLLMNELMAGLSMHDDGHKTGDSSKMGQSLQTLRSLQLKVTN
jgi:hypothetical protein